MEEEKKVLDVCCGSKMFWFDKNRKDTIYMDNRQLEETLCDGRRLEVKPDIVADFRNIPFEDNTFNLVVFDPPHLKTVGENSWLAKKYGILSKNWKQDISQGFKECMRVLKTNGTLVFKWNEEQIKLKEILDSIDYKPLFGNKRDKTHWLVFMKENHMDKECINQKGEEGICYQFDRLGDIACMQCGRNKERAEQGFYNMHKGIENQIEEMRK